MDQANVAELVKQAQGGDRDAFGVLMEMHQALAYRMAYRLTGQADAAEAVTQDAFVQAYRSLPQFKGKSRFTTWLYSILARKAVDRHRSQRRSRASFSLDEQPAIHKDFRRAPSPTPAEEMQGRELGELLLRAMMDLPSDQRAALAMVAQEGLTYRDAAEALGCSEGTVAWRVWNARRLLREMLKAHL